MKHRASMARAALVAGVAFGQGFSSPALADQAERPHGGSCATVVTPLLPDLSLLRIDLDCTLKHLGRVTGLATQTVTVIGQNGPTLVTTIANTTTYEAANGDVLNQAFSGSALIDTMTGEVQYMGTETFQGGTGRFVDASGTSQLTGTASIFTNVGFYTTTGTISY